MTKQNQGRDHFGNAAITNATVTMKAKIRITPCSIEWTLPWCVLVTFLRSGSCLPVALLRDLFKFPNNERTSLQNR
jgi:hypothetical protein